LLRRPVSVAPAFIVVAGTAQKGVFTPILARNVEVALRDTVPPLALANLASVPATVRESGCRLFTAGEIRGAGKHKHREKLRD
jgi:hypothetical protein